MGTATASVQGPAARARWYRDPVMWVEVFVLFNIAGLAADISLAHSINSFAHWAEYVPLAFSLVAPPVLLVAMIIGPMAGKMAAWRALGHVVGWAAIAIGIAGMVLHLQSGFFAHRTLASLVYAAPFAAPLAYTGLGLLLVLNRMVPAHTGEWPMWVLLLALGGFIGNFVFSLTDHAQNGFFYPLEWIPVFSSALAVGFLTVPFVIRVSPAYLWWCVGAMGLQAAVGLIGAYLHVRADLRAPGPTWFDRIVFGASIFAPLLFVDLVILALIGLWVLRRHMAAEHG
jgi:hypothetical protein